MDMFTWTCLRDGTLVSKHLHVALESDALPQSHYILNAPFFSLFCTSMWIVNHFYFSVLSCPNKLAILLVIFSSAGDLFNFLSYFSFLKAVKSNKNVIILSI